jgi:hypothetical protein
MKTQKFQTMGEIKVSRSLGHNGSGVSGTDCRPKNNSITFKNEIKTEFCKKGFKARKKSKKNAGHGPVAGEETKRAGSNEPARQLWVRSL